MISAVACGARTVRDRRGGKQGTKDGGWVVEPRGVVDEGADFLRKVKCYVQFDRMKSYVGQKF